MNDADSRRRGPRNREKEIVGHLRRARGNTALCTVRPPTATTHYPATTYRYRHHQRIEEIAFLLGPRQVPNGRS